MHFKAPYNICICSLTLGQLGLQYDFPENFRCNLSFNERENFSDSSLHDILESENFRFLFSAKNSVTWRVKDEKLNFGKL